MKKTLVRSALGIWGLLALAVASGCVAEAGSADTSYASTAEPIFGLSLAERTQAAIEASAQHSGMHQVLASYGPSDLTPAGMPAPVPIGENIHLLLTPFFGREASHAFVVMDMVAKAEEVSDETNEDAWHTFQSIAAYVEFDAVSVAAATQKVKAVGKTMGGGVLRNSNMLIDQVRALGNSWHSMLKVASVQAWTLSADEHVSGQSPRSVSTESMPEGADLLETAGALLAHPALYNGPQGWLAMFSDSQAQLPPVDQLAGWVMAAVVVLVGLAVVAVAISALGVLLAAGTTALVLMGTALAFLLALGAIAYVAVCFYDQALGYRACVPRLRAIIQATG